RIRPATSSREPGSRAVPSSAVRATRATAAPSPAKRAALDAPVPRVAPVTIPTRHSISPTRTPPDSEPTSLKSVRSHFLHVARPSGDSARPSGDSGQANGGSAQPNGDSSARPNGDGSAGTQRTPLLRGGWPVAESGPGC